MGKTRAAISDLGYLTELTTNSRLVVDPGDGSGAHQVTALDLANLFGPILAGVLSAGTETRYVFTEADGNLSDGQTVFPVPGGYAPDNITAYRNGERLIPDEVDDSSGTVIEIDWLPGTTKIELVRTKTFQLIDISAETIGLERVDNTSDEDKVASGPIKDALDDKLSSEEAPFVAAFTALFRAWWLSLPSVEPPGSGQPWRNGNFLSFTS